MAAEEGLTGLLDKGKHQKNDASGIITDDSIGYYPSSWNKDDGNSLTRDELLDLDSEGLN